MCANLKKVFILRCAPLKRCFRLGGDLSCSGFSARGGWAWLRLGLADVSASWRMLWRCTLVSSSFTVVSFEHCMHEYIWFRSGLRMSLVAMVSPLVIVYIPFSHWFTWQFAVVHLTFLCRFKGYIAHLLTVVNKSLQVISVRQFRFNSSLYVSGPMFRPEAPCSFFLCGTMPGREGNASRRRTTTRQLHFVVL
ncbi:hypothetical protein YC2023_106138 [Brassica napus]